MSEIARIAGLLEQTFEGRLDDSILDKNPIRVRGPFYLMLHGTMQHSIYHAGQISLLAGQMTLAEEPKP
jgi:uncharacterized damage-inducible protein DinB